jgi:hypothetical protein
MILLARALLIKIEWHGFCLQNKIQLKKQSQKSFKKVLTD